MGRPLYREIRCKSALNRVRGMPFSWSLNPYRGCAHACHYCYARASHSYLGLNVDEDFESQIFVKTNFVEVLRRELTRPSWRAELVAVGTATDCYQPAEGRYRLTRGVIECLVEARTPLGMVTKSPMVLRDLDLLAKLAALTHVRICFTITTVDLDLWRRLEPGTANPLKRLAVMQRLNAAGVPAGVLLAPILPGITDTTAQIEAVCAAAAEHQASFFSSTALRLAPLVKEHYLGFVGAQFPALLPRYQRAYPGTYAPPDYLAKLEARVEAICGRYQLGEKRTFKPRGSSLTAHSHAEPRAGQAELQLGLPL
jgi:DNA repair photolyase